MSDRVRTIEVSRVEHEKSCPSNQNRNIRRINYSNLGEFINDVHSLEIEVTKKERPERLVKNTTTKIERVRGRLASPTTGGEPERNRPPRHPENPVCPWRAVEHKLVKKHCINGRINKELTRGNCIGGEGSIASQDRYTSLTMVHRGHPDKPD
ncbi:hypothetical protein WN51_05820 [Melipona quadrifasciata]|uniref:Uncharacterized protein n=1 Tax=Melipona quadrifasciata TaxID=166423 RepID=A0A0M9A888_9HYME|nr:hypothetical protein WN51_05820 [Melipona quadrifasciata]